MRFAWVRERSVSGFPSLAQVAQGCTQRGTHQAALCVQRSSWLLPVVIRVREKAVGCAESRARFV